MKPSQTPRVDALVQVIDGGSEYAPLPDLLRLARNLERELDCAQENFRVTNKAYCDQNRELRELQARTIPPEAGWTKHDSIPNIKGALVPHGELHRPLVTRLPDGSWWTHPPVGLPSPQKDEA